VCETEGGVGVVDVEANACNETEGGGGGGAGGDEGGEWEAGAALDKHAADFDGQGAQNIYVVRPLYPEHVQQLRQRALHAAHDTKSDSVLRSQQCGRVGEGVNAAHEQAARRRRPAVADAAPAPRLLVCEAASQRWSLGQRVAEKRLR